jgi:two-component system sensor histidine kinase DesK
MPTALPALSDQTSELFGYVVREAVTNVVRHSRAGICTVLVEPGSVEVRDDGRGVSSGRATMTTRPGRDGSGLAGLRSRVEAAGGSLVVAPVESGGTVVRAELTGAAAVLPTIGTVAAS